MRLWYYEVLPYLPKSQIVAQWRELNTIFAHKPNHILINYVYEYPKSALWAYTMQVMEELRKRGYRINAIGNFQDYFDDMPPVDWMPFFAPKNPFPFHHTEEYLAECYFNLMEKHSRGQKDFSDERMAAIRSVFGERVKQYASLCL